MKSTHKGKESVLVYLVWKLDSEKMDFRSSVCLRCECVCELKKKGRRKLGNPCADSPLLGKTGQNRRPVARKFFFSNSPLNPAVNPAEIDLIHGWI